MQLFISHATEDDALVRSLQQALERNGIHAWIDSRELVGGDRLWPEIEQAIRDADGYLVLVSPAGLQSAWVGKELKLALAHPARARRRDLPRHPPLPRRHQARRAGALFDGAPLHPALQPTQRHQ
jgi:hypothetical protein